jgi:hypothetical protein
MESNQIMQDEDSAQSNEEDEKALQSKTKKMIPGALWTRIITMRKQLRASDHMFKVRDDLRALGTINSKKAPLSQNQLVLLFDPKAFTSEYEPLLK